MAGLADACTRHGSIRADRRSPGRSRRRPVENRLCDAPMSIQAILTLVLGMAVAAAAVVYARRFPQAGVAGWLTVLAMVPVWFGIKLYYYFEPAVLVGIVPVLAFAARPARRWCLGDILMLFFVLAGLTPLITGGATHSTAFDLIALWLVGFLVGRLAPGVVSFEWIADAIAVIFTIVGAWAVVEFAFHWHVFEQLPAKGPFTIWADIQGRGGQSRSEAAFGHSIAAGCSLALALPFVIGSTFRRSVRLGMCAVILAGVVFTLSRVSLGCAALALVLTVTFVRDERVRELRRAVLTLLGIAVVIVTPMLLRVFADAGREVMESSNYRGLLYKLVGGIDLLGLSRWASVSPSGVLRFGGFRSIDNAVLLTGLTYGALPLGIGLLMLGVCLWVLLSGRGSVAVASVAAQVPALLSVALITQYGTFLWFVAGLAVATSVRQSVSTAPTLPGGAAGPPLHLPPVER